MLRINRLQEKAVDKPKVPIRCSRGILKRRPPGQDSGQLIELPDVQMTVWLLPPLLYFSVCNLNQTAFR
jgi:hypothetical protein